MVTEQSSKYSTKLGDPDKKMKDGKINKNTVNTENSHLDSSFSFFRVLLKNPSNIQNRYARNTTIMAHVFSFTRLDLCTNQCSKLQRIVNPAMIGKKRTMYSLT